MFDNPQDWMGPGRALLNMWTDLATQMMNATMGMAGDASLANPPDAFRDLRSSMLSAWSKYCDQFMRSPVFAESLRQAMNTNIEMRRQMSEALGKMHHDLQGVSRQDLDQMMRTLRHLEQRIATGFERTSQRLDEFNDRLDEIDNGLFEDEEGPAPPPASEPNRAPRRRRRRPAH